MNSERIKKNYIEADRRLKSDTNQCYNATSKPTPALVQNSTALPGLPGVVVSAFVQISRRGFLECDKVLSDCI